MLSKYHRNSIITGPLEAFCLTCEDYLRTEADINTHIEKPVHKKNLDSTPYFEKFKDEYIRKVKKGYYCEFCNLLFSTAAKVNLHINEKQHKENKGSQLLKRESSGVLAFDNVLINEKAWNGFIDETCVICNTEFDNESIHRTEQSHVLNLIQSKLEFGDNKSIYRKIDESSFQCLTCNVVCAVDTFTAHFEHSDHKVAYVKCSENASKPIKESINISTIHVNKEGDKKNEKVPAKPSKVEATVTASVQEQTKQTKKNKKDTENKSGQKNINKLNPVEMDKRICEIMGAKNYVVKEDDNKFMCILCEWVIDMTAVSAHIQGQHHLTMLKMHNERLQQMCNDDKPETKEREAKEQPTDDDNKSKILDSVTEFQKNDININFESGTAVCKKCTTSLDFKFEEIECHIQNHKKHINKETKRKNSISETQNKKEVGKSTTLFTKPVMMKRKDDAKDKQTSRASSVSSRESEDIMEFAKQHNLRYTGSNMFCNICQSELPATFKNMKEHVDGSTHQSKLEQSATALSQVKPKIIKRISVKEFIKDISHVEGTFLNDIVINRKICINIISFLMIVMKDLGLQCECCEVRLNLVSVDDHKRSPRHLLAMSDAPVVVVASSESEFIREARPGVYHCGICNCAEASWDEMEEHLESFPHKECKNSADWRLQQHLPGIDRHNMMVQMQGMAAFMDMFNNRRFGSDDDDDEW